MIKRILFFLVLLIPGIAVAGTCTSIYCDGKITTLYPNGSNGIVYIIMDGNMSTLDCTLSQGSYIVLKKTNQLHSEIYSMLLSSVMAQRDIRVRILQGSADCELSYTMLMQ